MREMILTAGPSITDLEIEYVNDAVRNGWNDNWAGYISRFENQFSGFIGSEYAMTTSSCTGALHLILKALGIGPGDEVIVPDITWVATASTVTYVGATPVFCDIEENSWCIDITSARNLLNENTKAIIPVHLYGHPADMPMVMEFAKENNLFVIEDAAPSVGAEVNGEKTGSFGDASAFSFQGAKVLVTGEGGMITTDDEDLFKKIQLLGDHGRDPEIPLWNNQIGYKYKMSNLQAAMGLAQLERIEELVEKKRWINARYRDGLGGNNLVTVSNESDGCRSIHWMTSIEVQDCTEVRRTEIMNKMKSLMVDSRPVFRPLSSMPMFKRSRMENPIAYRVGYSAINLPSGHNLSSDDIDYVCEVVGRVCEES